MALTKVTSGVRTLGTGEVTSANLAAGAVDTSGLEDDIALLGFKVASNGSLAKYDLIDQTVDAFEDTSGVDASASTNEVRSDSKYYSGGVITRTSFTSTGSDTYATPAALIGKIEVLVVAGGGGGSGSGAGGGAGGAGGLVYVDEYTAAASTTYNLTIGTGGAGRHGNTGVNGGDSVFDTSGTTTTLTASGGGGGPEGATSPAGGSGGGGMSTLAAGASDQVATFGSYANVGFGNNGGAPYSGGSPYGGGGGGGAGAVGNQGNGPGTGIGGIGKAYTIADGTTSVYYAGGGGGGTIADGVGSSIGGAGGGGNGGFGLSSYTEATAGTANTGGGGGGGRNDAAGAAGGSGIIIVVHKISGDMTLVSNATTAEAVPTKGDIVLTYTNGLGTATINTDIKAYISRDNGTTYTQATLADQGDSGGHTVLTAHDLDISSQPSGSSMRYKITTHNQSASKETRIQAVSLGWS